MAYSDGIENVYRIVKPTVGDPGNRSGNRGRAPYRGQQIRRIFANFPLPLEQKLAPVALNVKPNLGQKLVIAMIPCKIGRYIGLSLLPRFPRLVVRFFSWTVNQIKLTPYTLKAGLS